jgi:hypothetical protein
LRHRDMNVNNVNRGYEQHQQSLPLPLPAHPYPHPSLELSSIEHVSGFRSF